VRSPSPHLSAVVRGVRRGVCLGALVLLMVLTGLHGARSSPPAARPGTAEPAYVDVVTRALGGLHCSTDEASSRVPSSALVRTTSGNVQVVTFRRGWDVYQGRRPGTLIAVCHEKQAVAVRAIRGKRPV
jgi:hypothetical protein